MTLKSRLTDLLHTMRDLQLTFDQRLTDAERDEVGTADAWSARDMLFHSTVWSNRLLVDLETIERGEAPPEHDYGDFEAPNRAIFKEHQHDSWETLREMIGAVYARADAYLERTAEEALTAVPEGREATVWRDIAGSFISHPSFHMWEYLEQHGYVALIDALFGEQFAAQLLALSDDASWRATALYNQACRYALIGQSQLAIKNLSEALRLEPRLIEWSQQDSDLDSLRDDPAFQALYE